MAHAEVVTVLTVAVDGGVTARTPRIIGERVGMGFNFSRGMAERLRRYYLRAGMGAFFEIGIDSGGVGPGHYGVRFPVAL